MHGFGEAYAEAAHEAEGPAWVPGAAAHAAQDGAVVAVLVGTGPAADVAAVDRTAQVEEDGRLGVAD